MLAEGDPQSIVGMLLGAIGALTLALVYLYKRIEKFTEREQQRSDRLASLIEKAANDQADD